VPKEAGLNLRFHIGNGASPEVFTNVPAETVNLNLTSAELDASDNESSGWGASLAGRRNGPVTLSGPYNDDNAQHALLQTKWLAQTPFHGRLILGTSGDYFSGSWVVINLNFGGNVNQVKTFQATLSSFEALTFVPGP
jgi:predicted secreted protein